MKRRMAALLLCLLLVFACTGCGGFDAGSYVKAVMDNFYLDESAAYTEIVDTTARQAHEVYMNGLTIEAQIFYTYMSFDAEDVDEQTAQRVVDLYSRAYKHAKYDVGQAQKGKDGYTVAVRVYPIDLFDQAMDELNAYVSGFHEALANGDYTGKSEEEISAEYQNQVLSIVEAHVDTIGYRDPVELTVQLKKDANGAWGMGDEAFQSIDEQIIGY